MSRAVIALCFLVWGLSMAAACAEPTCPDGYEKVGKICRRSALDGSALDPALTPTGDASAPAWTDASTVSDGAVAPSSRDAAVVLEASLSVTDSAVAAAPDALVPSAECSAAPDCVSGYLCVQQKCVSPCTQTRCDPNATCALSAGGAAACTCNAGFSASGSGTAVTCTRSVACEQLHCDANASCDTAGATPNCVCKTGYTGSGTTCTPVSCALTVSNGSGSPGTYLESPKYSCSSGYVRASGSARCESNGEWSGTKPECLPVDCKTPPSIANGRATTPSGTKYPAEAKYTCSTGLNPSPLAGTIRCQSDGEWSEPPRCIGCGDGEVTSSLGEVCEPSLPGWSVWTCDPKTCKRSKLYTPCADPRTASYQCDPGQTCLFGRCSLPCTTSTSCPATPPGVVPKASCDGQLYCVATGCTKSSDCAPGLICDVGSKACMACSVDVPGTCPLLQQCMDLTGDGTFTGVCN